MEDLPPPNCMKAAIRAIEYYLPETVVSNQDLSLEFPEWPVKKIYSKTGISERHIAREGECSSDLGVFAAQKLFKSGACSPKQIDYLLFCTQSPDFFLPTTACLIQDRLGVSTSAGALDFNLGCSGFIYGLSLAKGLIESGQAQNVLLITAETYSKFINPRDKSVRTIFGDAAAATLVGSIDQEETLIGPFVLGTDGRGGPNLMVPSGGMRRQILEANDLQDSDGNWRGSGNLYMNGAEVFAFTMREIPACINHLLAKTQTRIIDYDLFVFHQANSYMLNHLRQSLEIPAERFYLALEHCGNTVSSTIPIALKHAVRDGVLKPGMRVMLVGFGVGYSWGAVMVHWFDTTSYKH